MIDRKFVIAAYNLLLQRDPESEEAIRSHCKAPNVSALISGFMASEEFKEKQPTLKGLTKTWVWTEIENDLMLRVNLADAYVSWNIIENSFEKIETKFLQSTIKPGMHVLDIGANLGYFTILMSSLVGEKGKVDAFEPLPFLYDSLQKSITKNGLNDIAKAHNVALGHEESSVKLVYAPDSDNWGGAYLSFDGIVPHDHATELVNVKKISDIISPQRLDFIKIDVEGAEPLVLEAAQPLLKEFSPMIMSEVHPGQLNLVSGVSASEYIIKMEEYGYSCYELKEEGELLSNKVESSAPEKYFNAVFIPNK